MDSLDGSGCRTRRFTSTRYALPLPYGSTCCSRYSPRYTCTVSSIHSSYLAYSGLHTTTHALPHALGFARSFAFFFFVFCAGRLGGPAQPLIPLAARTCHYLPILLRYLPHLPRTPSHGDPPCCSPLCRLTSDLRSPPAHYHLTFLPFIGWSFNAHLTYRTWTLTAVNALRLHAGLFVRILLHYTSLRVCCAHCAFTGLRHRWRTSLHFSAFSTSAHTTYASRAASPLCLTVAPTPTYYPLRTTH